jgi:hypothetical protein
MITSAGLLMGGKNLLRGEPKVHLEIGNAMAFGRMVSAPMV